MIKLTKMTKKSFEDYMATSVEVFANEKVENGTWDKASSISNSKKEYDRLLPEGLQTPNNYFYSVLYHEKIIGYIWIAKSTDNENTAFIYDFEIYPEFQNLGFGTKVINLIEIQAKQLSFTSLALHVFGNNSRALHVYQKTGFQITDINMQKKL